MVVKAREEVKKKNNFLKMTRHGNNIVMVKEIDIKRFIFQSVDFFLARYKRAAQNVLLANIRIRKIYRGRPTQGRQVRVRRRAKPVKSL